MLEKLTEKAYVRKVEGVGYFGHLLAAVLQHDLRVGYNGAVNPFLCGYPAYLFYDGA